MMGRRNLDIAQIVESGLCHGCGTCAFIQPEEITMVDLPEIGRRPLLSGRDGRRVDTQAAASACSGPGYSSVSPQLRPKSAPNQLERVWGPILEVWEGYASDPAVRLAGSSGGVITALSLFANTKREFSGSVHVTQGAAAMESEAVFTQDEATIRSSAGSRYAPASPGERLTEVARSDGEAVFVGKPCDVAAALKAEGVDGRLQGKLGLTISLFCAGTPSTAGTVHMLAAMNVSAQEVSAVRYRGNGWPGLAVAEDGDGQPLGTLTYDESWGKYLQKHRQWRCHVCADHTGETADISVGDPWYRPIGDDPGQSLVVVRTERGREFLEGARNSGFVTLVQSPASIIPESQPHLERTRGAVFGRVLALRIGGWVAPRFEGMSTFPTWWGTLSYRSKVQSIVGTFRRAHKRGLARRAPRLWRRETRSVKQR